MFYTSLHTGEEIDAAVAQIYDFQSQIDNVNNSIAELNIAINNINTSLQSSNNNIQNTINSLNTSLSTLSKQITPIELGGTNASNINDALMNLGGSYTSALWDITSNVTGTINTSLQITTHGRPVFVGIQYTAQAIGKAGDWGTMSIYRDGTHLHSGTTVGAATSYNVAGIVLYLDMVPAGTYTYKFQYGVGSGTIQLNESNTPSNNGTELPFIFAFEI